MTVLRESELVRWLQRHPVTLTETQVQQLALLAAQPATWKRMPQTEVVDHAQFDRLHAAIGRGRGDGLSLLGDPRRGGVYPNQS